MTQFKKGQRVLYINDGCSVAAQNEIVTIENVSEHWIDFVTDNGQTCAHGTGSFKLMEKTLDTLEPGDIILDWKGHERKIIDVLPHSVLVGEYRKDAADGWYTLAELKDYGYTIEQPATTVPDTIEIAGKKYDKAEFEKAVKDLKEVA